jgi:hypothetical protein
MAAPTSPLESALELAFSVAMAGVGAAGASIGTTTTRFITTIGTTRPAGRFTTGTLTTGEARALGITVAVADPVAAISRGTGLPTLVAVVFTTVPVEPVGPLKETTAPLEATRNPMARPGLAPVVSATTTMAARPGVILHAAAPASAARVAAAEERLTAVVAGAAADITKWQESFFHRVQCET